MNIRNLFFWGHLSIGCIAALFIFLMSITGAALTYERQIIHYAESLDYQALPNNASSKLSLDEIVSIAKTYPHEKSLSVAIKNEVNAFVQIKEGRKRLPI